MQRSYHFDVGDSGDGPIGYCARIEAESSMEALQKLQGLIRDHTAYDQEQGIWSDGREYVSIYFNLDKLSVSDIDEVQCPVCQDILEPAEDSPDNHCSCQCDVCGTVLDGDAYAGLCGSCYEAQHAELENDPLELMAQAEMAGVGPFEPIEEGDDGN